MKKQKSDHVDSPVHKENSDGEDFDLHNAGIDELTTDDDEDELSESEDDEDEKAERQRVDGTTHVSPLLRPRRIRAIRTQYFG